MTFDLQPVLTGELLELRPLAEADFDELFAVAADPLIWEQHPESNRHEEPVFRRFFRGAMESGGAFVAVDRSNGRMIGSSRYHGYDRERSQVEIGWTFLARSHWGGRYNAEMKRLMLAHAFRFVEHVLFLVGPDNHRSRRAIEKVGGVLVGPGPVDRGHASVVYRISRSDVGGRPAANVARGSADAQPVDQDR